MHESDHTKSHLTSPMRRRYLKRAGAVGLGAALNSLGIAKLWAAPDATEQADSNSATPAEGTLFAYIGTYTTTVNGAGHGEGIYKYQVNRESGALKKVAVIDDIDNPSALIVDRRRRHLYAVSELAGRDGLVSAYAIDRETGELKLLNRISTQGEAPAYLSLHPSGRFLFVANYGSGSIAVFPVAEDGSLGKATLVHQDKGTPGPKHAKKAPPGNFAISGHDGPHAHMIQAAPNGKFVLSTDLGLDRFYVWRFDSGSGKLTPSNPPFVSVSPGAGPRHFAFHPNGRWLYLVTEEASTLLFYDYDAERGKLTARQSVSTLPQDYRGTSFASEVIVSQYGRYLYAANRLHNTIARFAIGNDGKLTWLGETSTRGDYPRVIKFDPSGYMLYVLNKRSDNITLFDFNRETGALRFTGRYTALGSPSDIAFLG